MTAELLNKLTPLWNDEAFLESLADTKNEQEMLARFAEKGVEITPEDMAEINAVSGYEDEMSEESLEAVSGGTIIIIPIPLRQLILKRRFPDGAYKVYKTWFLQSMPDTLANL